MIRGLGGGVSAAVPLAGLGTPGRKQPVTCCILQSVFMSLCFFFLPLVKRGTAEPQTALSAEKEAITFKKLGVAGGCRRVVKCVCVWCVGGYIQGACASVG